MLSSGAGIRYTGDAALGATSMANFDSFERLVRRSMVATPAALATVVREMSLIPNPQRPTLFRSLNYTALEAWVDRGRRFLREWYGDAAVFETSENNLWGSDLRIPSTEQTVELKSGGPVTDGNPGLSSIAWALGDSSLELKAIMSATMKDRQRAYLNGDYDEVDRSKQETMSRARDYFRRHLTPGEPAPARLQHYIRCVARGITTKAVIERLETADDVIGAAPTIFHADLKVGWRKEEHSFQDTEQILVESVTLSHPDASSSPPRLTVMLRGEHSGRTAKIYPHYKNSWRAPGGEVVPAANWVRTACFHIWIGVDRSHSQ